MSRWLVEATPFGGPGLLLVGPRVMPTEWSDESPLLTTSGADRARLISPSLARLSQTCLIASPRCGDQVYGIVIRPRPSRSIQKTRPIRFGCIPRPHLHSRHASQSKTTSPHHLSYALAIRPHLQPILSHTTTPRFFYFDSLPALTLMTLTVSAYPKFRQPHLPLAYICT